MPFRERWQDVDHVILQGILLLSSALAQDESGDGSGDEAESEGGEEGDASGDGEAAEEGVEEEGGEEGGEGGEEGGEDGEEGGEDEEECEEVESGDGDGDDIESILDPSGKKCKPKAEGGESSDDEPTGSEALAAEVGFLTPSFTTV